MLRNIFSLIVALVISGCAIIKSDTANKVHYEKISEAIVVWEIPSNMPIKYMAKFGPDYAMKLISNFISDLQKQSTLTIQNYLTQKGIKTSSKNKLIIKPIAGYFGAQPGVTLNVTMYNELNEKIWSIEIESGKSVIDSDQTTINRFIDKIIAELEKSGLTK